MEVNIRFYSDTIYWSELRPDQEGRCVICSKNRKESDFKEWTPRGFDAKTKVFEYGGAAFFVYCGNVYFSNLKDQRLYLQKTHDSSPVALTPEGKGWRYADGDVSCKTGKIYCVREDHGGTGEDIKTKEAIHAVVVIDPDSLQQTIIANQCDFYNCPRISIDGCHIAWVQWNHPNMLWDSTSIITGRLAETGDELIEESIIKIGNDFSSYTQPCWTEEGDLLYMCDKSEWLNLYKFSQKDVTISNTNVLPMEVDQGRFWKFGNQGYSYCKGRVITVFDENLHHCTTSGKDITKIMNEFTCHERIVFNGEDVYCEACSPTQFPCIVKVNLASGKVEVLRCSKILTIEDSYISIGEHWNWKTSDGDTAYGYYYPPQNVLYKAPQISKPPLLVRAHGGPIGQCKNTLNLSIQYFTSRGFAVLDVNYRGSTGYGTEYRRKLRGKWGVYDVDDCYYGAEHFVKLKMVDENRLCVDGVSAGGYTTLACLTFKSVFKAGVSNYGVCDLEALMKHIHKFESHYLDSLIASYSGDGVNIYKQRSPINSVENLNCAMAFFHGTEDRIVPPEQALKMYEAVKGKGLPTVCVMFEGEQHGFRHAENMRKALDGEFFFFGRVFGFEPADKGKDRQPVIQDYQLIIALILGVIPMQHVRQKVYVVSPGHAAFRCFFPIEKKTH